MRQLTLDEFHEQVDEFDDLMAHTAGVDRFCSSSSWVLSAYEAFSQQDASPWIFRGDAGWAVLYQSWHERIGRFAQPLEASWCLASPFATREPEALAEEFFCEMFARRGDWDLLFLSGVMRHAALHRALIARFSSNYFVGAGPGVSRHRASLEGGYEGYLSRRRAKFRANLRRIERRASERGVTCETFFASDPECARDTDWSALYERILELEARSWKGEIHSGIRDGHMRVFYERMIPRLVAHGQLRVIFLQLEGEDIAFIFGAVSDGLYRGLQVSFDDAYRDLSPGNLAQIKMIQALCQEAVMCYDLGSELEYKAQWAESLVETVPLVIRPW